MQQARLAPFNLDWRRFQIAEVDGNVVGVGQIRSHPDGVRELASIAVVPAWQNQGVATRIITTLLGTQEGPLFLMCESSLEGFYEPFGFRQIDVDRQPRRLRRFVRLGNIFLNLREKIGADPIRIIIMRRGEEDIHV